MHVVESGFDRSRRRDDILLLEHDAKTLLAARGLTVPVGILAAPDQSVTPQFDAPWVVKAQVPVGGRGKLGGVRLVADRDGLDDALGQVGRLTIKGFPVRELRIEQAVSGARELYLGLILDAASAQVVVMVSEQGGMEIEAQAPGSIETRRAPADRRALEFALAQAAEPLDATARQAITEAGSLLAEAFIDLDATLIELNPLFLQPNGTWVAGDVRMDVDENALPRQPDLTTLLESRASAYPEAMFKRQHGFDLVVVDPEGEIGLVTTGAGLSMQLIDEMTSRGLRPYNFCDIRSGGMRGDPARLVENFRKVLEGPRLKAVLVNIFAGITDLGEFADLLLRALAEIGDPGLPIVVRLVGNGQERAEAMLKDAGPGLIWEPDLDRAISLCGKKVRAHA